jgi:radical SAM superfamily enzyme YgiQ (UPF0313 family)
MRIRIIVNYVARYRRGHASHFVPPVTGMHLAALTPPDHEVELVHEQVSEIPFDRNADLVALSFFSGFARRAYEVADRYRALGVKVVAGGPHASYWQDETLGHVDAVVVGEAESVWNDMLIDAKRGTLKRIYRGEARPLAGLPTPRYDLLEERFLIPRVLQATRGCPFTCRFCTVPDLNPGFRVRPVSEVIRDIATSRFRHPWQDKFAWFWDDNLLVQRRWAKELLREMVGLRRYWLTQASIDIVKDRELLSLMEKSGCAGIFLGIESLDAASLAEVDKKQNRVAEYRSAIDRLRDHGICVMAGFISGFDEQTEESIVRTAQGLNDIGVDVPFLSILTPFRGTPLYDQLLAEGRILGDRGWDHYNGYNVTFRPRRMSPEELLRAHRELWNQAFGYTLVAERLARGVRTLSPGGLMLSAAMNGFYGLKRATGNVPAVARNYPTVPIAHPDPNAAPVRLAQLARPRHSKAIAAPSARDTGSPPPVSHVGAAHRR